MTSHVPDRLDSWKEIADYLGKGITTARRWEREEGLPVRRLEHSRRGSVVAYRSEIDAWLQARTTALPEPPQAVSSTPPAGRIRRNHALLWAATVTVALALTAWKPTAATRHAPVIIPVTSSAELEAPASLEPNGSRVAYSLVGGGIAVKPVRGGQALKLTSGHDVFPRWSPNGRMIAFSRFDGEWLDLMTIPPDGGQPRSLLRRAKPPGAISSIQWAAWDADSRNIILVDRADGAAPWALFRFSPETGERRQVTFPPASATGDQSAEVSPDGRHIAFIRYARGSEADVYVVPSNGGPEHRITHDSVPHYGLTWVPDGRHVIYAAARLGPAYGLWRVAADGSRGNPEPLERAEDHATWPSAAFAATGLQVAYVWEREPVNLRRWDKAKNTPPQTVAASNHYDGSPQYSPDGARLAFVSNRGGSREIWVSAADGSEARPVTHHLGSFTDSPRWSPDGTQLAFSTSVNDNRDIYVVDVSAGQETRTPRRITVDKSEEGRPSWSYDGRWIWFRSNRSGSLQIWKIAANGSGAPSQVTTQGGYEPFESPEGRWLYFAKERGQFGLWRIPINGGTEQQVAEHVREGWWSLAGDSVYFIRNGRRHEIWQQRLKPGHAATVLARLEVPVGGIWSGFSARRDGGSFLYPQSSSRVSDIIVLDSTIE